MTRESTLTLLVPGLFGPLPQLSRLAASELTTLSILDCWLARGQLQTLATSSPEQQLCSLFGVDIPPGNGLPLAAIALLAEQNTASLAEQGWWLRADPVCLRADRDSAVLIGGELLGLSTAEAEKFVGILNSFYAEEPWQLIAPHPQRWYLQCNAAQQLQTTPLHTVLGQDIADYLPGGADAVYWHKLLNEIQMLLYQHSLNLEREARGELTVNSLWLWGGGKLPATTTARFDHVYSDDVLVRGLCQLSATPHHALPVDLEELSWSGSTLITLEGLTHFVKQQDPFSWLDKLNTMQEVYFKPLDNALRQGKLTQLVLLSDSNKKLTLSRRQLRRWWRRCTGAMLRNTV